MCGAGAGAHAERQPHGDGGAERDGDSLGIHLAVIDSDREFGGTRG